ncbi:acyl-CoA thioesterase [Acinetobacter oleivorans]|uniref:acyl-CoA thioesterase n=1 Tax=Acinetobacter oleivorans TaxID=1148157 RepID=UPI003A83DB86
MTKPVLKTRDQFKFFLDIQTRWADNDIYGHVNNVTYYSYFDTAANALLIQETGFDIHEAKSIGLVVDSACSFLQELSFPEIIQVGVAIGKIGTTSLSYELAIFKQGQDQASAQGHFVHVFVDRETRKTVPISESVRAVLENFLL